MARRVSAEHSDQAEADSGAGPTIASPLTLARAGPLLIHREIVVVRAGKLVSIRRILP